MRAQGCDGEEVGGGQTGVAGLLRSVVPCASPPPTIATCCFAIVQLFLAAAILRA